MFGKTMEKSKIPVKSKVEPKPVGTKKTVEPQKKGVGVANLSMGLGAKPKTPY